MGEAALKEDGGNYYRSSWQEIQELKRQIDEEERMNKKKRMLEVSLRANFLDTRKNKELGYVAPREDDLVRVGSLDVMRNGLDSTITSPPKKSRNPMFMTPIPGSKNGMYSAKTLDNVVFDLNKTKGKYPGTN